MSIRNRIKELRNVRAGDLKPHPKNWRSHPGEQKALLEAVLAEVGWAAAAVAYQEGDDLILIDGHLRADLNADEELPVLVLDVDAAEAEKLLATMDPLAAMAGREQETLNDLLDGIETENATLESWLKEQFEPVAAGGLTDPDAVPPLPKEPVSKPGDLYLLGRHRLLCGNATNPEHVKRLLDGAKPFIMVTDPPYGVDYDPEWRVKAGVGSEGAATGKVTNDDRADWREAFDLFKGRVAYVWHGGMHTAVVAESLAASRLKVRAQIIWVKTRPVLSRGAYHWQHEPVAYAESDEVEGEPIGWAAEHGAALYAVATGKGGARWRGGRRQSTVWFIEHLKSETGHGTQKPVACMLRPIANHGGKDDAVYDPFVGSGTTLIAAQQMERACYAMEIDPLYVDVAVKRWEEFTGLEAEKLS